MQLRIYETTSDLREAKVTIHLIELGTERPAEEFSDVPPLARRIQEFYEKRESGEVFSIVCTPPSGTPEFAVSFDDEMVWTRGFSPEGRRHLFALLDAITKTRKENFHEPHTA